MLVEAGDIVPTDGEVIEGVASVDESAITGESAPVIRESGGDRSSLTGGTRLVSDWLVVRVTAKPGETFLDRMIPAFMWANSDQVAEQSLAALARNKRRIVPGAIGKMLNAVGYLPHMITSPINKLSYGALAGDNK